MKRTIAALCVSLIAGQATALSCMRSDPVETFQRLNADPARYFVIYGTLTFDEGALPRTGEITTQRLEPDPIPGRFEGRGLTRTGFATPYASDVFLQVTCAGPWCGSARSGGEALYFVPASPPPVTLEAGPCGGMIFDDPSDAVLDMLTSCMQGGRCEVLPQQ